MLKSTPLSEQYEAARDDRLRILVTGAGIAGITAVRMLQKGGYHPVLIEHRATEVHPGYMLALMPMVDGVLEDLAIREAYRDNSTELKAYAFHGHKGKLIREDSMEAILKRYGDYRGIARGALLEVLTQDGCPVSYATTIKAITPSGSSSRVQLESESGTPEAAGNTYELEFDLVIVAEGIHSGTRKLLLGERRADRVDTHWGGWVVWAPGDDKMYLGEELWGSGFFYGVYPVKDKLGVFLGGNRKDTTQGPRSFVEQVRKKLTHIDRRMDRCLQAVTNSPDAFFWKLNDIRSPQWIFGNTILLGDAAAGFLPTAGIGAGMAMESAWVLTSMLQAAGKDQLPALLRAYEKVQRPRVEAAQDTSRSLAKIMFWHGRLPAVLRDGLMKMVSVETAIRPIQKLVAKRPNPELLARQALNH